MKLVPVVFPPAPGPLTGSPIRRAPLRENGPIRITLRAIEAAPPTAGAVRSLRLASTVTGKKKTSADDVLLMLL